MWRVPATFLSPRVLPPSCPLHPAALSSEDDSDLAASDAEDGDDTVRGRPPSFSCSFFDLPPPQSHHPFPAQAPESGIRWVERLTQAVQVRRLVASACCAPPAALPPADPVPRLPPTTELRSKHCQRHLLHAGGELHSAHNIQPGRRVRGALLLCRPPDDAPPVDRCALSAMASFSRD